MVGSKTQKIHTGHKTSLIKCERERWTESFHLSRKAHRASKAAKVNTLSFAFSKSKAVEMKKRRTKNSAAVLGF